MQLFFHHKMSADPQKSPEILFRFHLVSVQMFLHKQPDGVLLFPGYRPKVKRKSVLLLCLKLHQYSSPVQTL